MLEKFNQNNKAENIRRWLGEVDLASADLLKIEKEIYAALAKSQKSHTKWIPTPIAPYAEPVRLDELVGDVFNEAQNELRYQVARLDNLYSMLPQINNNLKAELETIEKAVTQATDDVQQISIVVGDESKNYYWVSDSFNSDIYVDKASTTALIDTDYGQVTLSPEQLATINGFTARIDSNQTKGIPGANLYVTSPGKFGIKDKEPEPILESTETRNFGAVFDLDPSSWFEIERNFLPKRQKLKLQGRAYIYSESGEVMSIEEVTKKLDWRVIVAWPDGRQDAGEDGKGVSLVEWQDLDGLNTPSVGGPIKPLYNDVKVKLAIELSLNQPIEMSMIKILPFVREDAGSIILESMQVLLDDMWVDIAKDIELGTNKSTTKLQREVLRRTGVQSTGSIFSIPTNRPISKIRLNLSSAPTLVKHGLAHAFKDVYTEYRTERNYVLFNSVDKRKKWGRVAIDVNPPTFKSSSERPKLVGTAISAGKTMITAGNILNTTFSVANKIGPFFSGGATSKTLGSSLGLGNVGTWLGRATPWISAVLAVDSLVGGLFHVNKSSKVLETRNGYDVFRGYRAAIALRDISLLLVRYTDQSTIQSIKREFPGPVTKIGLYVDEDIPDYWGAGEWISYFVSIDGTNWKSIPKLNDSTLEKSLVLGAPTKEVYFKAILNRNTEDPYHTPIIKHYALQGLPA